MSEPATILNVNDHEPTRYLVTRLLSIAGFRVSEASTGQEALVGALNLPDLIILDVKLPDMSGLDVCRMIKSRPETSSVYVLQTSATFVTAERRVAGLDSGADGYLAHPFEAAELIATVNSLMRLKAAETALRQRADALAEANRRKDHFLAMLAHELRNPLAAVVTGIDLVERVRTDEPRFNKTRDMLQRQTRHLARLIDDLLDVSRITRDRIELRRERCDVAVVLEEVVQAQGGAVRNRGQRLVLEASRNLFVDGDHTRLHQVLGNLVDNASKYTPAGGTIEAKVAQRRKSGRDYVVVSIVDDGVGMSPDFLPRAFDLFAQADVSLDRATGGLGIGLTLAKKLVELHGGDLHAHSDGPGRGSTFEVWLPSASAESEAGALATSPSGRSPAAAR